MGASVSVATSNQIQQTAVKQTTVNNNECITTLQQNIKDVSFNIIGSNIDEISVVNRASLDVACVFNNNIDSISQTLLTQAAENATETEGGGFLLPITPLGVNIAVTESTTVSELSVEIEQLINNVCSTNVQQSVQGVTFNVFNSDIGTVAVGNFADVKSQCIVENLAKIETQSEIVQEATNTAGGRSGILYVIIIVVVIIAAIIALVSIFSSFRKKCEPIPPGCSSLQGQKLADCLAKVQPQPKKGFCPVAPTTAPTTTTKKTR